MARRKEQYYVFTPGAGGAGTIKIPGHIELNDLLQVTNVTRNEVIYGFAIQGLGATRSHDHPLLGDDPDFPYSIDGTCTFTLQKDTSGMASTDELLILIEDERKGLTVRPFDFGVDAIERQRVSNPESLIDADFEYGLQSSKWQDIGFNSCYPSFATGTGSTISLGNPAVVANGTREITVNIAAAGDLPAPGEAINITGLTNPAAEGSFVVITSGGTTFTYLARTNIPVGTISTANTALRNSIIYDQAELKLRTDGSGGALLVTDGSATAELHFQESHGLIPGSPFVIVNSTGGTQLHEGNFYAEEIVNGKQINFTLPNVAGAGDVGPLAGGFFSDTVLTVYAISDSQFLHRPFDGGVQLTPYVPVAGIEAKRQTKRYFRYQSGKGILFSSGTLFSPVLDVQSATYAAPFIEVTTAEPHRLNAGASVALDGFESDNYNSVLDEYVYTPYVVSSIVSDFTFRVTAAAAPTDLTAVLGREPRAIVTNWHGAAVRAGVMDDANGMFWEYDGRDLSVVLRSCTNQIAGKVSVSTGFHTINGQVGVSKFTEQLRVGDRIQLKGQVYLVGEINSDEQIQIYPAYRGVTAVDATILVVNETRIKQSQFNNDRIDGTGPSGYNVHLDRMQMIGVQYSWYGAGYVDFMMRGPVGDWITCHRISNNNFNTEAYMRSGNLPARYASVTGTAATEITDASSGTGLTINVKDTSRFPDSGFLLLRGQIGVDNIHEVVQYSGKTATSFTGLNRATSYQSFVAGSLRTFSGVTDTARDFPQKSTVLLIDCTAAPTVSHWGSAVIMDGGFNGDRGIAFSTSRSTVTIGSGAEETILLFRPAPSVSDTLAGALGERELLNRSRIELTSLQVVSNAESTGANPVELPSPYEVVGILNPTNIDTATWNNALNSTTANGVAVYQPSFSQVATNITAVPQGGEVLFRFASRGGTDSYDLSDVKELQNSIVGGDGTYPNGPEAIGIVVTNRAGRDIDINIVLNWSEAQA